jgi:hypothetical protein
MQLFQPQNLNLVALDKQGIAAVLVDVESDDRAKVGCAHKFFSCRRQKEVFEPIQHPDFVKDFLEVNTKLVSVYIFVFLHHKDKYISPK